MQRTARNTFCILFLVKKNDVRKSGLATIMVRLTINGEQAQFSCRLSIDPALWDIRTKRVIGNDQYSEAVNRQLDTIRKDIQQHYIRLSESLQYVSVHRLRQAFLATGEETLLSYQFREQVKIYRSKAGRNICTATANIYKLTLDRLFEFMELKYKVRDIHIQKIDLWFLEKFYLFLRKKYRCSNNTAIKYMKRFASVMNFAQKTGLIQVNPFNLFRFHIEKKEPVYLTEEELKSVTEKEFITRRLNTVRDAFVFSSYTGLSFSDIKALKLSDILKDESKDKSEYRYRLRICRTKTNTISYIPLLDKPLRLIEKYTGVRLSEIETKPRIKIEKAKDINNRSIFPLKSNQNTNEYLKEIAELCNINKRISFHSGRHSFASLITLEEGVPIETISRMLGHSNIQTTQIYARVTPKKLFEDMDKLIEATQDLVLIL
ncbi:MAG: site-specific integrase [Prevotella sp.]|jgi:site-specific recombinase XerD|nr:site-specific integrase [Prevotella sp.]